MPTPDEVRADESPVLLFDGVCNLCTGVVQFVIRHDPEGTIRFASLQSDVGRKLASRCGISASDVETVVLVEGDECHTRSGAALRTARHLGWPYAALAVFRVVPRRIRDVVYDCVATHRYEWFGQKSQCMVPPPGVEERFLDSDDVTSSD